MRFRCGESGDGKKVGIYKKKAKENTRQCAGGWCRAERGGDSKRRKKKQRERHASSSKVGVNGAGTPGLNWENVKREGNKSREKAQDGELTRVQIIGERTGVEKGEIWSERSRKRKVPSICTQRGKRGAANAKASMERGRRRGKKTERNGEKNSDQGKELDRREGTRKNHRHESRAKGRTPKKKRRGKAKRGAWYARARRAKASSSLKSRYSTSHTEKNSALLHVPRRSGASGTIVLRKKEINRFSVENQPKVPAPSRHRATAPAVVRGKKNRRVRGNSEKVGRIRRRSRGDPRSRPTPPGLLHWDHEQRKKNDANPRVLSARRKKTKGGGKKDNFIAVFKVSVLCTAIYTRGLSSEGSAIKRLKTRSSEHYTTPKIYETIKDRSLSWS